MKLAILLVLGLFVPSISADESSHKAKIEELLSTLQIEEQVKQVTVDLHARFVDQIKSMNMPAEMEPVFIEYQDDIFKLVEKHLGWDAQKDLYVDVYSRVMTEADIEQTLAFFNSETGDKFLRGQQTMGNIMQAYSKDHMGLVLEDLKKLSIEFNEKLKQVNSNSDQ